MLILHPSLAAQVLLEHQIERLCYQSQRRWARAHAWHRRVWRRRLCYKLARLEWRLRPIKARNREMALRMAEKTERDGLAYSLEMTATAGWGWPWSARVTESALHEWNRNVP